MKVSQPSAELINLCPNEATHLNAPPHRIPHLDSFVIKLKKCHTHSYPDMKLLKSGSNDLFNESRKLVKKRLFNGEFGAVVFIG